MSYYGLWPDTRVITGKLTQEEYEAERYAYVKAFVTTLVRDLRFTEEQVRRMVEDALDGDYTGESI